MIWMISTYSPSSSSSATVWDTSRSNCPSTRPKVCHRCSPPSIRSCTLRAKGSATALEAVSKLMPCFLRLLKALDGCQEKLMDHMTGISEGGREGKAVVSQYEYSGTPNN